MPPPKKKKKKNRDEEESSAATFSPAEAAPPTQSPSELWHPPWMKGELPDLPTGVNDWEAYPSLENPDERMIQIPWTSPEDDPTGGWHPPLYYYEDGRARPIPIPSWKGPPPTSKKPTRADINLERMKQGLVPLPEEVY